MSFIDKLIAKRNLKENQAEKIFKSSSSAKPLGDPYQLICVDYADIDDLKAVVGSSKIAQRLHVMKMIIVKSLVGPEEFAKENDLLRRCGINLVGANSYDYVLVQGSLSQFFAYIAMCIGTNTYSKLSTFICGCLATCVEYDVWYPEQRSLLDNYVTSDTPFADDKTVLEVSRKFSNIEDIKLVRIDYQHDDPHKGYAMSMADTYVISTYRVSCFIKKCIAAYMLADSVEIAGCNSDEEGEE